jgi:DNA-binding NarL/FixJ family response regulator
MVADDHEIVRKAVRRLIEGRADWEVCAEAANGEEALALAAWAQPDVAIVDLAMPGVEGVALTLRLQREAPRTRVLVFTMHDDRETVQEGLAAGARGFVLKADDTFHLVSAVEALARNRSYVSPSIVAVMSGQATKPGHHFRQAFTLREREVAQLMSEGNSNKRIAGLLGLSIKTVESYRSAAMRKAGSHSAAEFVRFAIKHHLVSG